MKPPVSLPRLKVVTAGPFASNAEVAASIAAAVLGVQAIFMQGLINSGLINGKQWRSLFQASLDELPPAEQHQAWALCLGQMIDALDAIARGEKPAPKFH
jgi:hypothetical protein